VAQNNKERRSAIYQRTTRHPGSEVSQETASEWKKSFGLVENRVGLLRKTRHCELALVGWASKFATAAYDLVRIRNLDQLEEETATSCP
jgi:hypothetical protein